MMNSSVLKSLEVKIAEKKKELSSVNESIQTAKKQHENISKEISNIKNQIELIKNASPVVSEHAILRYLERIKGIDLKAVTEEILSGNRADMISTMGSGTMKTSDYDIVFKNRCVVTIYPRKK